MQACRDRLKLTPAQLQPAAHAALVLRRFLQVAVQDTKQHPAARAALHASARTSAANARAVYEPAYARWIEDLPKATSDRLDVQGRLIVGLGGDNVLETGLTLHHTYGVPIIPGSALKGLAAHYCDQVWGARLETDSTKLTADNYKFRRLRPGEKRGAYDVHPETGNHHEALFGTTDESGPIIFHDAWITPDSLQSNGRSGLVLDVMTPHHGDYYSDREYESGPDRGQRIPPTDFDNPNPVTFLSVSGSFLIAISCDVSGQNGDVWAKLAFDLLQDALRDWGVGGKTSSGYGRFAKIKDSSEKSSAMSLQSVAPSASAMIKRKSGTTTKVTILESRPKGFKVEESGRLPGTLTLGPCPSPAPQLNDVVDVLVHVDDPKSPQYKWPDPNAKTATTQQSKKGTRR